MEQIERQEVAKRSLEIKKEQCLSCRHHTSISIGAMNMSHNFVSIDTMRFAVMTLQTRLKNMADYASNRNTAVLIGIGLSKAVNICAQ